MSAIQLKTIRIYWRRLRLCRWAGSVVTDYRIIRNYTKYLTAGAAK